MAIVATCSLVVIVILIKQRRADRSNYQLPYKGFQIVRPLPEPDFTNCDLHKCPPVNHFTCSMSPPPDYCSHASGMCFLNLTNDKNQIKLAF